MFGELSNLKKESAMLQITVKVLLQLGSNTWPDNMVQNPEIIYNTGNASQE